MGVVMVNNTGHEGMHELKVSRGRDGAGIASTTRFAFCRRSVLSVCLSLCLSLSRFRGASDTLTNLRRARFSYKEINQQAPDLNSIRQNPIDFFV